MVFPLTMSALVASIPSPGFNTIGPFTIYGFAIAIGAAVAIGLAQQSWIKTGGHEDDMASVAMWAVPAGVVGARLYHFFTDFQLFRDRPWYQVFLINEGGLGIPGGMLLGVMVGIWAARRRGMSIRGALDAAVPGFPLAQAIGRIGNYFNQELYGRPTDLPWGLEIDADHRFSIPAEFQDVEAFPTFHPTFLYEMLWNIALTVVLLRVRKLRILPPGRLIAIYLLGYGLGRLWIEALRIDSVNNILGLRLNIWMSAILIISGIVMIRWPYDGPGHPPLTDETAAKDNEVEAEKAKAKKAKGDKSENKDAESKTKKAKGKEPADGKESSKDTDAEAKGKKAKDKA